MHTHYIIRLAPTIPSQHFTPISAFPRAVWSVREPSPTLNSYTIVQQLRTIPANLSPNYRPAAARAQPPSCTLPLDLPRALTNSSATPAPRTARSHGLGWSRPFPPFYSPTFGEGGDGGRGRRTWMRPGRACGGSRVTAGQRRLCWGAGLFAGRLARACPCKTVGMWVLWWVFGGGDETGLWIGEGVTRVVCWVEPWVGVYVNTLAIMYVHNRSLP